VLYDTLDMLIHVTCYDFAFAYACFYVSVAAVACLAIQIGALYAYVSTDKIVIPTCMADGTSQGTSGHSAMSPSICNIAAPD